MEKRKSFQISITFSPFFFGRNLSLYVSGKLTERRSDEFNSGRRFDADLDGRLRRRLLEWRDAATTAKSPS